MHIWMNSQIHRRLNMGNTKLLSQFLKSSKEQTLIKLLLYSSICVHTVHNDWSGRSVHDQIFTAKMVFAVEVCHSSR